MYYINMSNETIKSNDILDPLKIPKFESYASYLQNAPSQR